MKRDKPMQQLYFIFQVLSMHGYRQFYIYYEICTNFYNISIFSVKILQNLEFTVWFSDQLSEESCNMKLLQDYQYERKNSTRGPSVVHSVMTPSEEL